MTLYIVFEGIDGAGKTTQIKLVKEMLEEWAEDTFKDKLDIRIISEKEIHVGDLTTTRPNEELIYKYAIQRLKLQPIIESNIHNIVLSDRSYISSMAYQGLAENYRWVGEINKKMNVPDLIVFFRKETEYPFYELVQENYEHIFATHNFNFLVVDTANEKHHETTKKIVGRIIQEWDEHFEDIYRKKTYFKEE